MVSYNLRTFGDPILKTPATQVLPGEDIADLLAVMQNILNRNDGLGISAQQVGSTKRVAVMRLKDIDNPGAWKEVVAINLRITDASPEMQISHDEGCLSVRSADGRYFRKDIRRHVVVSCEYEDEQRRPHVRILKNLDAIIAQHEADHLDGKCIADGTTREERKANYRTLRKENRK